jgi:hypothetical protein
MPANSLEGVLACIARRSMRSIASQGTSSRRPIRRGDLSPLRRLVGGVPPQSQLLAGLADAAPDDLVLPRADGETWPPDRLSSNWAKVKVVRSMKRPKVTFHARLTHGAIRMSRS